MDSFYPQELRDEERAEKAATELLEQAYDDGLLTREEFDTWTEEEQESYVDSLITKAEEQILADKEAAEYARDNDEKYDAWKDGD
jgi:hypothetical protein